MGPKNNNVVGKLEILAVRLTRRYTKTTPTPSTDHPLAEFQTVLDDLEKTLAEAVVQPSRSPIEPITEQQRIIDLAG